MPHITRGLSDDHSLAGVASKIHTRLAVVAGGVDTRHSLVLACFRPPCNIEDAASDAKRTGKIFTCIARQGLIDALFETARAIRSA
jgi:hypothetical protein